MRGLFRFLVWVVVILGIVIGAARAVALRWWRVPDNDPDLVSSLEPTLHAGDLVILWRLSPPGFGDLVVCPDPHDPGDIVVGRIVGQGGDKIGIKGSNVYINERMADTETACTTPNFTGHDPTSGAEIEQACGIEVIGGVKHERGSAPATTEEYHSVVGDGQVFLLSDNRQFPFDSRRYGTVDPKTCKETVIFRLVGARGFSDVDSRFSFIH